MTLDFMGFKEWIIQVGIFIYSKKPHDYSAFPPLFSLEKMLNRMKETMK